MRNEAIQELLSEAFSTNVDKKLEPITKKIAGIEVDNIEIDTKIERLEKNQATLERKVDIHKQKTRENNIIITELKEEKNRP